MRRLFLSFFGFGLTTYGSGTIASITSLFVLIGFHHILPDNLLYQLIIWLIIFAVIYWLSIIFIKQEIKGKNYDQGWIVIDEFLGMMVVYTPFLLLNDYNWRHLVLALVLFRLFDIFKPFGISKIDSHNTPNSVILDDVVAGVYTVIVFYLFITFIN